jgi:putative flippase GtrA
MNVVFVKFLFGGVANTAITYTAFVALAQLMSPSAAYTVSYVAGIGLSYLINSFFVFRVPASLRSVIRYPVVYLVQYILGLGVLLILTKFGLASWSAMIGVIIVTVPITFALTRLVLSQKVGKC